ncbi:MAG: hypothetical protein ACLFUJ_04790 [Phycisphaerae bacterium]
MSCQIMVPANIRRFLAVAATLVMGLVLSSGCSEESEDPGRSTEQRQDGSQQDNKETRGTEGLSRPLYPQYDPTPAPQEVTAGQIDAAMETYGDSLLFLAHSWAQEARVDWDLSALPNGAYIRGRVRWKDCFDAQGKSVIGADDQQGQIREPKFTSLEIALKGEDLEPIRATGLLQLDVPFKWNHVQLSAGDVGKSVKDGSLVAELTACEGNRYSLQVSGVAKPDAMVFFARDDTGRRLVGRKSMRMGGTIHAQAAGRVASVDVYVPYMQHKAVREVVALDEPDDEAFGRADGPAVPNPRYQAEGFELAFEEMTAEELRSRTKVLMTRNHAMFGFNQPEVRVYLPAVDNSAFAEIDFGSKEQKQQILRDQAGQSVACEIELGVFGTNGGGFGNEIRFNPADDAEGPVQFARAVGQIQIRYPAVVRRVVLTRQQPTAGDIKATFQGNRVRIEGWQQPDSPSFDQQYAAIRAYDATGKRLAMLDAGMFFGGSGRFWGNPLRLELIQVDRYLDVAVPFDLAAPDLLPEDQKGQQP